MDARTRINAVSLSNTPTDNSQPVVITGINLSIWNMTKLLVKLAIASLPAAIILFVFWTLLFAVFAGGIWAS